MKVSNFWGLVVFIIFINSIESVTKKDWIFVFDATANIAAECDCMKNLFKYGLVTLNNDAITNNYSLRIGIVSYHSTYTIVYGLSRQLNMANLNASIDQLQCNAAASTNVLNQALGISFNMFLNGGQPNSVKYLDYLVSTAPGNPSGVTTALSNLVDLGVNNFGYLSQTKEASTVSVGFAPSPYPYTSYCALLTLPALSSNFPING